MARGSGTKETLAAVLRWAAAALLFGGLLFALVSGLWGVGALVFGFGAVLLGVGQVLAAGNRPGCAIGGVLIFTGSVVMADSVIRLVSGL